MVTCAVASAQEDLLALESNTNYAVAALSSSPRLDDGSLAPEHRGQSFPKYKVDRQMDGIPFRNPTLSPAKNPITPIATLGQQLGEYMRRIGDYFYWFVSGNAPITRKRFGTNQRYPGRRPIRRKHIQGRTPALRYKKWSQRRQKPQQNFYRRMQKISNVPDRARKTTEE